MGRTSDGFEYDMAALMNYTSVQAKYNVPGNKEALETLEQLRLSPRKAFTGVKVLREGQSGLYDELGSF